ncbi:hypothetical protein FQN49_004084 [Arthroderma sp. PD_2]|nr:hypothetical protein FQN49_004084 [Arthroderma sp. PD_2]
MSRSKEDGASNPNCNDDDYLAQLLAKEARDCSLRYSSLGVYGPTKRSINGAPKPNTRFLKHILRETDSHNANLKRKEEEEARERMRSLREDRDRQPRSSRREERNGREYKRRRVHSPERREERQGKAIGHGRDRGRPRHAREADDGNIHSDDDDDGTRSRKRRRLHREHRSDTDEPTREPEVGRHERKDEKGRHHRHHRRHKSPSRVPERVDKSENENTTRHHGSSHRRSRRHRDDRSRSRSNSPTRTHRRRRHSREKEGSEKHKHMRSQSHSSVADTQTGVSENPPSTLPPRISAEENEDRLLSQIDGDSTYSNDSDPLRDIIGPAPPPASSTEASQPLRSRGRGAYKATNSSNIDTHFSSNYDPALDVHLEDGHDAKGDRLGHIRPVPGLLNPKEIDKHVDDDWDMALEALRDRALWKRKGAERLRKAGFEDNVVERWEASKSFAGLDSRGRMSFDSDSRDIENVKWAKKGEGREWDRGKVIDEDGHVSVKPAW